MSAVEPLENARAIAFAARARGDVVVMAVPAAAAWTQFVYGCVSSAYASRPELGSRDIMGQDHCLMAVSEGNRLRVLVVEDEIVIRINLASILHSAGYAVIEAASGAEAISILDAAHDVDAVVSDIRMPGPVDGIALARVIRQRDPTIPVILASADSPSDGALPAHFAFLPKPFGSEAVLETVKRAIEERRISRGSGPGRAESRGRPSRRR